MENASQDLWSSRKLACDLASRHCFVVALRGKKTTPWLNENNCRSVRLPAVSKQTEIGGLPPFNSSCKKPWYWRMDISAIRQLFPAVYSLCHDFVVIDEMSRQNEQISFRANLVVRCDSHALQVFSSKSLRKQRICLAQQSEFLQQLLSFPPIRNSDSRRRCSGQSLELVSRHQRRFSAPGC